MTVPLPFTVWEPGTPPEALSDAVFAGRLVVFAGLAPVAAIGARARRLVETAFGPGDPEEAEARLPATVFRKTVAEARRRVRADPEIDRHWRSLMRHMGYADGDLHRDRVRLRVVPSRPEAAGRFVRPLAAHRDSWGSGFACQINWWMPLHPLAPTRTMVLWPALFDAPVANTAADWDYDTLLSGRVSGYPLLPVATAMPEAAPLPIILGPGALLAFSAAHLHASLTDGSGRSRLSLDTRTVWAPDVAAGRGAPDVDGAGRPPRWDMFDRDVSPPGPDPQTGPPSEGAMP